MSHRWSSGRLRLPGLALALAGLAAACGSSEKLLEAAESASATEPEASQPSGPREWPAGVETFEGLTNLHAEGDVDYDMAPPAGGDHSDAWQNCGIYEEPVPDERAVHSLEHGAVWLTYRTDVDEGQVAHLEGLVGASGFVLLSPHDGQGSPVTATAWGVQLQVDDAEDPRIERFLLQYVRGAQSPEPGAPCTGGTGDPATGSPT